MNQQELKIINDTQNEYEDLLIEKILNKESYMKTINFSSPTGTGKTKMMAEVIEKMNTDFFFVITTLSKGQLNKLIREEIKRFTNKTNYLVYGLNDYTKNTILQAEDILFQIPNDKIIIWFRDEGHIATNRWMEFLEQKSNKIVNFSATNKYNSNDDINCNFTHTMMLRTVIQSEGEPEDAIKKLLEVKEQHRNVLNYNPCAIFRVLEENILESTIELCRKYNLKYINITDETYDMSDICKDDNEYDVIINKFKIVEGIDIRRAHVLYMTNEPKNPATTIQVIGRCRRNALLYRNDIDILAPENEKLLKDTRMCYVFYNVCGMNIDEDENGNLVSAFCPIISVEDLKPNIQIELKDGILPNGFEIFEADKQSGIFKIVKDDETGFNILNPRTIFYRKKTKKDFCNNTKILYNDLEISILSGNFKISKVSTRNVTYKIVGTTLKTYPYYTYTFLEDKQITSLIAKNSKLNRFLTFLYYSNLKDIQSFFFQKPNIIFETKKLNSMFGYCVEYTAHFLFDKYNKNSINDKAYLVRKAIVTYQQDIRRYYNIPATRISSMSYEKLVNEKTFCDVVFENALKIVNFILTNFTNNKPKFSVNLSVKHFNGIADLIIDNTIVDFKCTSCINEKYIKQVLAYYWLSTKHSMNIKNVMIYEVITDRWIKINMQTNKITSNY